MVPPPAPTYYEMTASRITQDTDAPMGDDTNYHSNNRGNYRGKFRGGRRGARGGRARQMMDSAMQQHLPGFGLGYSQPFYPTGYPHHKDLNEGDASHPKFKKPKQEKVYKSHGDRPKKHEGKYEK